MGALKITNMIAAAGMERTLNVRRDLPDIRDRMYEPALVRLEKGIDNRKHAKMLNQGSEGSCTGHGLAAVINMLNAIPGENGFKSSRRMLYEMAKKHDEWPGEDYEGSSCRGAIRGWKNMGVCSEKLWPYTDNAPGDLTIERAMAARDNTLGAYYRLRPEITDYHAAINQVGAVYVSARVHQGWIDLVAGDDGLAVIDAGGAPIGGHAFAIVGYTAKGFIVQNSWGANWASKGFAMWRYVDWIETISDGWVLRLALPTPEIFGLQARSAITGDAEAHKRSPRRLQIAGHFVHFDNGEYKKHGKFWSTADDIEQTAARLANSIKNTNNKGNEYKHLLIYAHGGLNPPAASARRIAALKDGFKRNGIYPFHIMYDTGLVKETTDAVKRALSLAEDRSRGFVDWIAERVTDVTDKMIEDSVRKPVTAIWDEMKSDARWPFEEKRDGSDGDGWHTIKTFAGALKDTGLEIHLAGHSTGAVLLGHLLTALDGLGRGDLIKSCNLMAPACTIEFFNQHYKPRLDRGTGNGPKVGLPTLNIYNLNDELELDDNVVFAYRKSLLYLVSRALERQPERPILGMQKYSKTLKRAKIYNSDGKNGVTKSTSHGGFDNDRTTLNHIMRTILGAKPDKPFTVNEMEGY